MSPAVRFSGVVLVVALVGYAGWLILEEPPETVATPPVSANTPRTAKPAAPQRGESRRAAPTASERTRRPAVVPAEQVASAGLDLPPETARARLEVMIEDIEAKAERGETMSQPEWVNVYKTGNELATVLAKAHDANDENAQKEFGELNSRFRLAISKVQPRSP